MRSSNIACIRWICTYYINASELDSGTIPDARFPATLPTLNGSALTNLNGSNISSGTVSASRVGNLGASKITTGTFDAARILV